MSIFVVEEKKEEVPLFNKAELCEAFEKWMALEDKWTIWKHIDGFDYVMIRMVKRKCVYRVNPNFNEHDITREEFFNQIVGILFKPKDESVTLDQPALFNVIVTDNLRALENHLERFKSPEEN